MRRSNLSWLVCCWGALALAACGGGGGTDGGDNDSAAEAGGNEAGGNEAGGNEAGMEASMMEGGGPDAGPEAAIEAAVEAAMEAGPDVVDSGPPPMARTGATNGSAIALSSNDRVAVAVNRTAGVVSVFTVDNSGAAPVLTRVANLDVGATSEPSAVVFSNDDSTAYVILRKDQRVRRITGLGGTTTPVLDPMSVNTGSEPTAIAISPTGARLYVANWADGTVQEISTSSFTVTRTIDLNAALVATGFLGSSAPTGGRPGLAHPRALVVTNNGNTNDDDETLYVTEFFSQARTTGVPTGPTGFDVARQGVVYRVNTGTGMVAGTVTLGPVTDTGFQDSTNTATGCFPNQLYAAALNGTRLYIPAVCESPVGPTGPVVSGTTTDVRNFKTEIHSVLYVVDTATNMETIGERVLLTQRFQQRYDGMTVADDATRRMPLVLNDLAFVPGATVGYLTSYGSDAVFRIRFNADGSVNEVGSAAQHFINLAPTGTGVPAAGRLPLGIAITHSASNANALVINENSRNVSVVAFASQAVTSAVQAADAPAAGSAAERANNGRRFFATGLGRWSLRGQGWNSCETCHPDGLTDNVTWFFARGPRQTTSLDGTFSASGTEQRLLNWTAIFDEVQDFENNTRGNSGGVGAVVHMNNTPPSAADRIIFDGTALAAGQRGTATPQAGLTGAVADIINTGVPEAAPATGNVQGALPDWNSVNEYVRTIRPPRRPTNLVAADVTAGQGLFVNNNCAACHGGALWSASRRFWTPSQATNAAAGTLRAMNYMLPSGYPAALNPVAMMGGTPSLRYASTDVNPAANDQINCVLRGVGTYPATGTAGIAPMGVNVLEVRADMTTQSQGARGFGPPALVGMGTGAPYFHAGNARTLEEAFSTLFQTHYQAHSSNFLTTTGAARDMQVAQLIAFLQSIDDDTTPITAVQGSLPFNPILCPATFP